MPKASVASPPTAPPSLVAPAAPRTAAAPSAERRRVAIADRVARVFSPLACVRGFHYFARRRVELSMVTEDGLEADVRGKRTQHVRLCIVDGRLGAGCTCAANVLGPAVCRHVWATLLEIDRQALLPNLRLTERTLALAELEAARDTPRPAARNRKTKATAATRVARPKAAAKAARPGRRRRAARGGGA